MALDTTQTGAIAPVFALLPAKMAGKRATVMLLAIGLQTSRLQFRRQIGGPARDCGSSGRLASSAACCPIPPAGRMR